MLRHVLPVARYFDGKLILSRGSFDRSTYIELSPRGDDNY